ncbi:S-formylglutathione hydrolase FrmB [Streptomyces zhaozhouensis]|uniref:Acyl-CoA:diacylglycerol acyltransferase n=1 Tax=Streptomyces zhaozhouensis TaxID=1300267 RepID=A0A286DI31_9ACTN|nr:alpha/beta hydrolase-fold protein [Streptomyces zhaozhouensis]SOD58382.1 S-formylglutathione hydrolase FrmB [Streptomyces zhaozhouensis]
MTRSLTRRAALAGAALLTAGGSSLFAAPAARATPVGSAGAGGRAACRLVGQRRVGERLVELTLDSPALGTTAPVTLLTPRGWDRRKPGDRWPTLYLLAGGDGDHTTWTSLFRVQELVQLRVVLVVMPAMPVFGFWTDWWNHGVGGTPRVRSYFLDEVVPLVERDYGAGPRRAAAGESQGGFGALGMAARLPGLFGAVATFSAPVHPIRHPEVWLSGAAYLGVDGSAIWGDPWHQWEVWLEWDPVHHAEGLVGTPVYLASGDGRPGPLDGDPEVHIPGTEKWIALFPDDVVSVTEAACGHETRALDRRLTDLGAPVTTHLYRGTHSGTYGYRELRHALPTLLDALEG